MKVSRKGFTLIEILVVISIVGLLSSVFLVGLSGFRSRGRDARRLADIKSIQQGIEIYYTQCGFYPGTADCAARTTTGFGSQTTAGSLVQALVNTADLGISKVPDDPLTTKTYFYGAETTQGQSYVVGASLENPGDRALDDDEDATTFGVTCADPVYCVKF